MAAGLPAGLNSYFLVSRTLVSRTLVCKTLVLRAILYLLTQSNFTMNFKHLAIAVAIAVIPAIADAIPAQASAYRSSGGGTILEIRENPTYAPFPTPSTPVGLGEYKTLVGGATWHGNFNAPLISSTPTTKIYQGPFQDYSPSGSQTCTGTIKITRTGTTVFSTTVLWTITGGTGCPAVGSTATVTNLSERIPVVSNASGDVISHSKK